MEGHFSPFQIDAGKEWRGGQRQSFFLAKELKRKGLLFHYCVQPSSPLHRKALEANLPVIPIKIGNELDIAAVLRLASAMKRRKCRLVHFHDAHSITVGSAAASLAKVPLRIISRRVDFQLKSNYLSRVKYMKHIDVIIAVSEGVKNVLIDGGINPGIIRVVPDGIDFTPYNKAVSSDYLRREISCSPDDFLVGIVAHLADHKGHKYLIQATKLLKEVAPKIKVIIVGEGPLEMELNRQVKEIDVEDMVFFLGFRKDVPQILASLDLFVLSSHMEGMGSILMDAMACRLPVVASKVGGIPEVVIQGETGLLVPPRRPSALAKSILKLYNDRALASRLGERGYEVVHQKFSAESMADKIINVYDTLAWKKGINIVKV